MFGPVEGLKVVVEVDTATAQTKLREFSGSMALAGAAASDGLSPAQQRMNEFLDTIHDTRQRAEELELSLRNMAAGSDQAATGVAALGLTLGTVAAAAAALVGVGLVAFLADAVRSSEEFKTAMSDLGVAYRETKEDFGDFIVQTFELDTAVRGYAGTIKLVSTLLKENVTGPGSLGSLLFGENQMKFLAALGSLAPKAKNYQPAGAIKPDEDTAYWDRVFKGLEKSVAESKKLASESERVKKEFDESVAHVYRMVEATEKEYWKLQGLFELIDQTNAKFTSQEDGGTGWFGLGSGDEAWNNVGSGGEWGAGTMFQEDRIAAIVRGWTEMTDVLNVLVSGLGEMNRQLAVQMGLVPPLTESTNELTLGQIATHEAVKLNAEAFAGLATAQIMAALAGETSWKKALNTIAKQMVTMNLAYALQNLAFGIMASTGVGTAILGGTAPQFYAAAAKFAIAAAAWGVIAAVSGGFSSGTGGSGAGGKGRPGGKEIVPAVPSTVSGERETVVNVVITGQGYIQNLEAFARELSEQMTRELRSAGR
jgi:hypothetical protein